jgi:hypothetical protein
MQCRCGFENAPDAQFCGKCRAPLREAAVNVILDSTAPLAVPPVAAGRAKTGARPISRWHIGVAAAIVLLVAAGYWWMSRPPGRYKPDNGGLYPINNNGKSGFMDRSGKTVITPQFDSAGGFSEGLAEVMVGTKWGYINTKGVVAITPQFDAALFFRCGRARVKLGNRWGFIDKDGKYICSPSFLWATEFSGDFAPVQTLDGVWALVDRSGKLVLMEKVQLYGYGFNGAPIPAAAGARWGFINKAGKWVIDPQFESAGNFADGLAPVRVGGRIGYIDIKGTFIINPQYDPYWDIEFYDGHARFASGSKIGFVDTKGRVITDTQYLDAFRFSEGLAAVKTKDGWGFIDSSAKMVIRPQFDRPGIFQGGLARVAVSGKETYITTTGSSVPSQ